MPFSQDVYLRALHFAARAHGEQKTPMGLPYVVHLSSVTMELIAGLRAEPGADEDLAVSCALLHDVLEDTGTARDVLEREFGAAIAAGVAALTKDEALPKAERMKDSLARILREPREIAMVKLADRITNLAPPPSHWTPEKIAAYAAEAQLILDTLGHASAPLGARLGARLARYPHLAT
ncbi:HD domain-containing protein [Myxococcota bacterium]|nr:HD domain-containing protein [Myxococcota bacterium]